ncbi:MAG: DMT family transporter [Arenicella sp.]
MPSLFSQRGSVFFGLLEEAKTDSLNEQAFIGSSMSPNRQPLSIAAISLGVFTVFLWGLWPVLSRFSILQAFSSNDIVALRFWVAGLVLLPYLIKKGWGGLSPWMIFFVACTGGMLYVYLALTGLVYAPAGHAGMIIPSTMMVTALMGSWCVFGDKPTSQKMLGVVIIIIGIFITHYLGGDHVVGKNAWVGHFLFAAAGFCWGSFTVAARKANIEALHMTAIISVTSMMVFTPIYFVFGEPQIWKATVNDIVLQGLFQGVIISILALYTYTKTIELMGPSRAALFGALVPGFAALIAYPVLGEIPRYVDLVGLMLVTLGMVVTLKAR